MKKKLLLLYLLFLIPLFCLAQSSSNVFFDFNLSQNFGSENLISINTLISKLDYKYIPKNIFKNKNHSSKMGNIAFRLSKIMFFNLPIIAFTETFNHEYFGHKLRWRQCTNVGGELSFNAPWPYSSGKIGGSFVPNDVTWPENGKSFVRSETTKNITEQDWALMLLGGMEASGLMAKSLRRNFFLDEWMNYHEALAYFGVSSDHLFYVLGIDYSDPNDVYDPLAYLISMNKLYGKGFDYSATVGKKLKSYAYMNFFLNPTRIFGVYGVLKYIITGDNNVRAPFIRLSKKLKYMFNFRAEFAPYGPELIFENYIKYKRQLFNISIRHTEGSYGKGIGVSLETYNLKIFKKISYDLAFHFWNQDNIEFNKSGTEGKKNFEGFGGAFYISARIPLNIKKFNKLNLFTQLGYKTGGYLAGEELWASPTFRIGISY